MKKTTFLKTLLMAVGLCMGGANAWAKSSVWSENFESTTIDALKSAWTGNDGDSWGTTYSPTLELQTNKCNNSTTWFNTFSPTLKRQSTAYYFFGSAYTGSAYQFDAKFNLNLGSNGGESRFYVMNGAKAGTNADPSNYLFYIGVNSSGYVYISNGTNSEASTIGGLTSGTNSIAATLVSKTYKSTGWFDASCIIDFEQNKVTVTLNSTTTLSVSLKSGTEQISGFAVRNGDKYYGVVAMDDMALYSLTYPAFTLSEDSKTVDVDGSETVNVTGITGDVSVVSNNTSVATASYSAGTITIDGVASGVTTVTVTATNDGVTIEKDIEVTVGAVATTTVTVNYLCGVSAIAEALELTDVTVGSTLTASDITYDEVIYGSGVRYVNPTPDQTIPYTVVEDGVININYTSQAAVTNVKKVVKAGDVTVSSTNVAQDGKYVGDVINFSYPAYINYNGTLYNKGANSKTYNQSFTLTGTDQECILAYTATDITNVVYYSEGESVTGATATSAGSNMSARSSNQACGYAESDITLINLPAGGYRISIVMYANSSAGATLNFQLGDEAWNPNHASASNWIERNTEFSLASAADVKWLTSGNTNDGLDFVYIQKTGEAATITAAGWTTFASPYALNLSSMTASEGTVEAYYASAATGSTVTLTSTESSAVAAGEGLMLKGTAGATITIPVVASGSAIAGNLLKGQTTTGEVAASTEGAYHYVFGYSNTNASVYGFYNLASDTEVAAGKAYLETTTALSAAAARLSIVFDDETTGIGSLNSEENKAKEIYNLQGQRVDTLKKGLYIVNGKKVMVK